MGEMIGRCPKCGEHYYGWALRNPDDQGCEICGCELEIYNYKDAAFKRTPLEIMSTWQMQDVGAKYWEERLS
jgi:uncharacterized protein (DUF983 family)